MPTLDQIRKSIDARLTELNNEMATLQAARAALHATSAAAAPTAAASPRREPKPRRRQRPSAGSPRPSVGRATAGGSGNGTKPDKRVEPLLAGKLEAMLQETPDGLSAITISKRANAGYNQVRDLLRELEAAGQVRRSGTRRTSLWRLITEEQQIAERAAELERLSLAKSGDQPGG